MTTTITLSDAIDQLVAHFSQPDVRFGYDHEAAACCYFTDTGAMCAVGVLLNKCLGVKDADDLDKRCIEAGGDDADDFNIELSGSILRLLDFDIERPDGWKNGGAPAAYLQNLHDRFADAAARREVYPSDFAELLTTQRADIERGDFVNISHILNAFPFRN